MSAGPIWSESNAAAALLSVFKDLSVTRLEAVIFKLHYPFQLKHTNGLITVKCGGITIHMGVALYLMAPINLGVFYWRRISI